MIAGVIAFLMLTWRTGVRLVDAARTHLREEEGAFIADIERAAPCRSDGIGAFLSAARTGIPLALTHNVRHNKALQKRLVLVSVIMTDRPTIVDETSAEVTKLAPDVDRVVLSFGFIEDVAIPHGLACSKLFDSELGEISYYIGRETVIADARIPGMAPWREALFVSMQRNTSPTADSFRIPSTQLVEIGTEVRI